MRKIFVSISTGYCGEDSAEVMEFSDDASDRQINQEVHEEAVQWAFSFDHSSEYEEWEDYDEEGDIQERVEGTWEDYVPEKHDQLL
jgi:hypothetical protein